MIQIDASRCVGCGACVADCFPENLFLEDGVAHAHGACIECGHCFAVCPADAVDMGDDYPLRDVIEFSDWQPEIDDDTLLAFIKSRRSIRRFRDEEVPREVLTRVLDAGRFTPTGGNAQNVRYIVVQQELPAVKEMAWSGFDAVIEQMAAQLGEGHLLIDTLHRLRDHHAADANDDRLFFNAPVLLLVCSPAPLNAGLAASSIELAAHACGLGVLYTGFVQRAIAGNPDLCARLAVKPEEIVTCMLIGHPAVTYQRTAPRKSAEIDWR